MFGLKSLESSVRRLAEHVLRLTLENHRTRTDLWIANENFEQLETFANTVNTVNAEFHERLVAVESLVPLNGIDDRENRIAALELFQSTHNDCYYNLYQDIVRERNARIVALSEVREDISRLSQQLTPYDTVAARLNEMERRLTALENANGTN